MQAKLGDYMTLGREAAEAIPKARLVEFPAFGHVPQIQDPEGFNKALIAGLRSNAAKP